MPMIISTGNGESVFVDTPRGTGVSVSLATGGGAPLVSEMKSFCAECFQEDCELVPTRPSDGSPMPWSEVVEHAHRMFREHWKEPHKSRYESTVIPPTTALYTIKAESTARLAAIEAVYAAGKSTEEVFLNYKAYALWSLAYVCLLLKEFEEAQDYYTTFMNVNLAYFNADHEDLEHALFVFQRTLKAGHGQYCAIKWDQNAQKPCSSIWSQYADIVENPLLATGIKSMVPLEISKFML